MIIKEVTRTYSRSINTKSYGGTESWVKVEATYTGTCESGDDPLKVSEMLIEQAQKDVTVKIAQVIEKVKAAHPSTVPATMAPASGSTVPLTPAPRAL